MKTALLLILFVSNCAIAKEDWFCTHESGKREGATIWACGVGESLDENGARSQALKNAQAEFESICSMDKDCNSSQVSVEPKRTSCQQHRGHVKCYRLLVVTLKT